MPCDELVASPPSVSHWVSTRSTCFEIVQRGERHVLSSHLFLRIFGGRALCTVSAVSSAVVAPLLHADPSLPLSRARTNPSLSPTWHARVPQMLAKAVATLGGHLALGSAPRVATPTGSAPSDASSDKLHERVCFLSTDAEWDCFAELLKAIELTLAESREIIVKCHPEFTALRELGILLPEFAQMGHEPDEEARRARALSLKNLRTHTSVLLCVSAESRLLCVNTASFGRAIRVVRQPPSLKSAAFVHARSGDSRDARLPLFREADGGAQPLQRLSYGRRAAPVEEAQLPRHQHRRRARLLHPGGDMCHWAPDARAARRRRTRRIARHLTLVHTHAAVPCGLDACKSPARLAMATPAHAPSSARALRGEAACASACTRVTYKRAHFRKFPGP
eukprot:6188458-Pleurochrysis_carterae.AAC.2